MLSMSLTLGVVATLQPLIALGLTIPEASQAEDISPRNPAADGKCMVDSGFAGWCGIDGLHNGCLDGDCNAFNIGAGCHCDDPHRYVSNWGCLDGSFCYRKAESGCEDEGEVEEDLPVDDTNPLIAWCNAGNEIPALSVVAGVYENTMIYTCNFLDKPIGCDFNKEVQAGIDQEIGLCGYGKPGWAFSRNWNKTYGLAVNGTEVCTNILCSEPLYIDENGEIHEGDCQETADTSSLLGGIIA